MLLALEMHDFGVQAMQEPLRWKYPEAGSLELEAKLARRVRDKPMPEHRDLQVTRLVKPGET